MILAHVMGLPVEESVVAAGARRCRRRSRWLVLAGRATLGRLWTRVDGVRRLGRVDVTRRSRRPTARSAAEEALLDAAERLLVEVGHAGITTRRLAEEAGVNHGLVHYYFGSMENLLVRDARALHRAADRAAARDVRGGRPVHREVADGDALPRRARTSATRRSGSSCRRSPGTTPELRERLARVNAEWRAVLTEAFAEPHRELGIEMPLDALVSLVMTFNEGIMLERLGGIDTGPPGAARLDRPMAVELSARRRASRRGRATRTRRATSSATASGSSTRSTARASRRCCCCRRGRSSTRATGRCRSRTSRATAASSRSTGAATASSDRPRDAGGVPRGASSPPTRSPCWTRPGPSARSSSSLLARRAAGAHRSRPSIRSGSTARSSSRRRFRSRRGHGYRDAYAVRRAARRRTRAGRSTTRTTGCATTRTSSSSSSRSASPSRTRPSRSRTRSAGGSRPTPRRSIADAAGAWLERRGGPRALLAGCAARCS